MLEPVQLSADRGINNMRAFTEEQNIFRETYRSFLANEVAPHMDRWREAGIVGREIFARAGELGFLMIWPDEK